MARLLVLLIAVPALLICGLAGCGGAGTYTDAAQPISVKVGAEFVIAQESNPSTGYSWQPTYEMSELQLVERTFQQREGTGGTVGAGGTESFRFRALKGGSARLTLVYKRSWEQQSEGQITKVFTVNIAQ